MTYRVIQWATGNVGRSAIAGIIAHPDLELAGVWVHSADKVGRDAGELCGLPLTGVTATNDVEELLALGADCVLYSPLLPVTAEVTRLLEAGLKPLQPGARLGAKRLTQCRLRGHKYYHPAQSRREDGKRGAQYGSEQEPAGDGHDRAAR